MCLQQAMVGVLAYPTPGLTVAQSHQQLWLILPNWSTTKICVTNNTRVDTTVAKSRIRSWLNLSAVKTGCVSCPSFVLAEAMIASLISNPKKAQRVLTFWIVVESLPGSSGQWWGEEEALREEGTTQRRAVVSRTYEMMILRRRIKCACRPSRAHKNDYAQQRIC